MTEKTLHAWMPHAWSGIWMELHTDFELTKRIKYIKEYGEFIDLALEISWEIEERRWYSFWKTHTVVITAWVRSDRFGYKFPHKENTETFIEECN